MAHIAALTKSLDALLALSGNSVFDITEQQVQDTRHLPLAESREVRYLCNGCGRVDESHKPDSFLRCSCCKAVFYCSKNCQLNDWREVGVVTSPYSHKQCCPAFIKDKKESEEDPNGAQVRTCVFPWADQHHASGAFLLNEFLCRRGLYGKKGFWARPETMETQINGDDRKGWCHGQILLESVFLP